LQLYEYGIRMPWWLLIIPVPNHIDDADNGFNAVYPTLGVNRSYKIQAWKRGKYGFSVCSIFAFSVWNPDPDLFLLGSGISDSEPWIKWSKILVENLPVIVICILKMLKRILGNSDPQHCLFTRWVA
jgi:hypothetical protein